MLLGNKDRHMELGLWPLEPSKVLVLGPQHYALPSFQLEEPVQSCMGGEPRTGIHRC